ncbi:MAG: hypothetical protein LBK94_13355 [Prevotellaceae bacterium]|jgi:hypothetical protein|nr:hypothetical protein [Prevotellaceae bacterium]
MRKVGIMLSVLALIASSCGQTTKKPTAKNGITVEEVQETVVEQEKSNSMVNQLFDIEKIDSVKYFALKRNADSQKIALEKIDDLEQAKKMLTGRVIWGKYDDEAQKMVEDKQGKYVYKIEFRDGKTISYDYPEFEFIAYFPQEDVLFIAGEHYSPMICNLTTGEETDEVGDPENRCYSPSKQYRFNEYYSGQVDIYFIQEKSEEKYKTIIELDLSVDSELNKLMGSVPVESFADVFWQSDTILNFVALCYFYEGNKYEKFYYQLILK